MDAERSFPGVKTADGIWWKVRQLLFLILRTRKEVCLLAGVAGPAGHPLQTLHIGDPFRAHYLIDSLYDKSPEMKNRGYFYGEGKPPGRLISGRDLELVEINRLSVEKFVAAGYLVIPEWVTFGCPVIVSEEDRYKGAGKSLKSDLRTIARSDFDVRTSRNSEDFDLFYENMYLPYVHARFGAGVIDKPRSKLYKDFQHGFLLLLTQDSTAIAGGIVRLAGDIVELTTIGMLRGSEHLLRSGVSGILDYHLHEWAANNAKTYIGVGHTRPFPRDGVFFNKRKWQMGIEADHDGVMALALKWHGSHELFTEVFSECPFVFYGTDGLEILCVCPPDCAASFPKMNKFIRQHWVKGISRLVILCVDRFGDDLSGKINNLQEYNVALCPSFSDIVNP